MKFECQFRNVFGQQRTIIVDVTDDEIAIAERTPGDTAALLVGTALSKAAAFATVGATPLRARRLHWSGAMKFEIDLVNPKTNEQRSIELELTADQVSQANASDDPVFWVMNFAKPHIPPGFMPMGGAPLRPSLGIVR